MTIDEFLDKVPWHEMATLEFGEIRHRQTHCCPILVVAGGSYCLDNHRATVVGSDIGLSDVDCRTVMQAADFPHTIELDVRAEMFRRMEAAQ